MKWKNPHKPVGFEVAILAKEKGYNLPCNEYYAGCRDDPAVGGPSWDDDYENMNVYKGYVSAPSYVALEYWVWNRMDEDGNYIDVDNFTGSDNEVLIQALNACKYESDKLSEIN